MGLIKYLKGRLSAEEGLAGSQCGAACAMSSVGTVVRVDNDGFSESRLELGWEGLDLARRSTERKE